MVESRQLEDRMRDAYSQLRRSAYELGAATSQDERGIRVKALRSSVSHLPGQMNGQGREVTVLENGMVVEHVDVRKEERGGRQQRRREEKRTRPRKSSRGSAFDVASMYSTGSPLPQTDSGLPLLPSRSSTSRPMSVLTSPGDTLVTRGMQSNASVEALSMISTGASPRRRFFGVRNLSPSVRSSDSLAAASGMSGSMVDMQFVPFPWFPLLPLIRASLPALRCILSPSGYVLPLNWVIDTKQLTVGEIVQRRFLHKVLTKSPRTGKKRGRV